ncbi:MAG TPA: SLBB domain-containing protein [Candidatus Binataceae bacterium]|nr:SLBB domain-containing protein [Candidatus Binataceae bacterium]
MNIRQGMRLVAQKGNYCRVGLGWIGGILLIAAMILGANTSWAQMGGAPDNGGGMGAAMGANGMGPAAAGIAGQGVNGGTVNNLSQLNKLDPALLNQIANQLGISSEQALELKNQLSANGTLTNDQLEQLSARLAAKHFSDSEITSFAHLLGMTDEQIFELKSHISAVPPEQKNLPQELKPSIEQGQFQQPPSNIETKFRATDSPNTIPQAPVLDNLTQFGYTLFTSSSTMSTFAPVDNVPVGNDYVIGPGDELDLLMWGRLNRKAALLVKRDGTVLIDEIGPVQIGGLSFGDAKHVIESRVGQITGVQVDVTMGPLRTIQVYVYGEVPRPGAYTVSALSHVSNALMAAGGISKVGSLRNIQLRRGNQVVRTIDFYEMLLRGDTAADLRLEGQDVIFVPVIGAVAAVAGDVNRPAIYEIGRTAEPLSRVIQLAGGVTAFGYSERVQIERIESHRRRVALDINLEQLRSQRFDVRDGDLVKIYPVLPERKNIVTLIGNVHRPGEYQWREGMRVSDLIHEGEGLANHTFFQHALIRRATEPERATRFVSVDLGAAMSDHLASAANLLLYPRDELTVYREDEVRDVATVKVVGEVRKPGVYELSPGMKVSDLVYEAGGLKEEAYQRTAELARTEVIDGARTRHSYVDVDLQAALTGTEPYDRVLQRNDQLFVRRVQGWHLPWVVTVKGRVALPGPYTVHTGERLDSVLQRCGGVMPDAYLPGVVFIRQSVRELQQERLDESRKRIQEDVARLQLMPASLSSDNETKAATSQAMLGLQHVLSETENQQAQGRIVLHLRSLTRLAGSPADIELEDKDEITVPKRPSSVNVLGQVYSPTAIIYDPSLTVQDYFQRAGGPTRGADTDHTMVVKVDGSVLTDEGVKNSGKARTFPLLPVVSGGLMDIHLEPGDTIYVPEKFTFVSNVQYAKDITQIIANSAVSLGTLGLLATQI